MEVFYSRAFVFVSWAGSPSSQPPLKSLDIIILICIIYPVSVKVLYFKMNIYSIRTVRDFYSSNIITGVLFYLNSFLKKKEVLWKGRESVGAPELHSFLQL